MKIVDTASDKRFEKRYVQKWARRLPTKLPGRRELTSHGARR